MIINSVVKSDFIFILELGGVNVIGAFNVKTFAKYCQMNLIKAGSYAPNFE